MQSRSNHVGVCVYIVCVCVCVHAGVPGRTDVMAEKGHDGR